MAALAFKAISYGAEQIPDKFFEKIPGGFFTPAEQKEIDKNRKTKGKSRKERRQSEEPSARRSSRRERSPPTEYSDYYTDDSEYEREREQRKRERRRAKSAAKAPSRSLSRGRHSRHDSDLDGQYSDTRDMAQPGQGQPYFPPPPASEYRPYNPQEYAPSPVQDHRPSATPAYGYPSQVNNISSLRRATLATMPEHPTPAHSCPPMLGGRSMSSSTSPFSFRPHLRETLSRGSPVHAAFIPSYEPPLAALLQRPVTNTPKPAAPQPYGRTQDYGQHETSRAAARYTPDAGYAPSPVADAPIPPPPVGSNSPMNPYHHTDFPANGAGYQPSPPPFSRQRSNSQPPFAPMPEPAYPTYPTANREQVVPYAESSPRRDSTRHRRDTRHRARSVDSHSHHSRSSKDHRRDDDSRMAKMRDRFDSMDLREKSLAASLGGAAAGALGARQVATRSRSRSDRRSMSRSRSRSRTRTHDRERSKGPGLRARSRSIIDRFRSKSRGPEDRDAGRDDRRDDRRDRRPDRGYDYSRDEYDYFSSSSEGTGSPVKTRRHRKREY
ncbi:PRP38-assoc multi-domain protein [Pyrenophora tritici-repentis]|uniref:PRP38-assoc multi-domain protein n=1 Tax=Pyrenophora tritici-repentis TaxID=45151 RepID=A0A922T0H3_9PLEO|nr:PRP38-assoc multi-domain protein [Pyrenophora tritici-repentis]